MSYEQYDDYDSWNRESGMGIITKTVLFIILFSVLLLVIVYSFNMFRKMAPFITENCVHGTSDEPLYDYQKGISSRKIATAIMSAYLQTNATFTSTSFETCGVAYKYRDSDNKEYLVCEDGKIYRYGLICKKGAAEEMPEVKFPLIG